MNPTQKKTGGKWRKRRNFFPYCLVVRYFQHRWFQCTSISFLISPFVSILTWIAWQFRGGLSSGRCRSLGYHSTTGLVHLLSTNLATCPAQRNFCFRYYVITFTLLISRITSFQICSRNDIPSTVLSIALCVLISVCSSFFVVSHVSLVHKSQAKWCYGRDY